MNRILKDANTLKYTSILCYDADQCQIFNKLKGQNWVFAIKLFF